MPARSSSTIAQYPTYVTFFSTAEKLSLGGLPFIVADEKPTRRDALAYYRAVVRHFGLPVRQYERVHRARGAATAVRRALATSMEGAAASTRGARRRASRRATSARRTCSACRARSCRTSTHVYREGHDAFDQDVVVVGGGNSAAEAALDLWRTGARVTLVHFGPTFDKRIKPWVLPDFENRMKEGAIARAVEQPRGVDRAGRR